jgi:hypothetical protein
MVQSFYDYMVQFLKEKNAKDVVEIGSDTQLKLAANLAPYVENFYSVNFAQHHALMWGWYDMHQSMRDITNIRLLSGDALKLSTLIAHADVIVVQNVLIDSNMGEDTGLLWKYRRNEIDYSDDDMINLINKFRQAEEEAYGCFLKVAKPGYLIRFEEKDKDERFKNLLVSKLGVDPVNIQTKELLYDNNSEYVWDAYIIDNL